LTLPTFLGALHDNGAKAPRARSVGYVGRVRQSACQRDRAAQTGRHHHLQHGRRCGAAIDTLIKKRQFEVMRELIQALSTLVVDYPQADENWTRHLVGGSRWLFCFFMVATREGGMTYIEPVGYVWVLPDTQAGDAGDCDRGQLISPACSPLCSQRLWFLDRGLSSLPRLRSPSASTIRRCGFSARCPEARYLLPEWSFIVAHGQPVG